MQVKDAMPERRAAEAGPTPLISSGREVLPALGLAWANCVNMRLFLSRQTAAASGLPAQQQAGPEEQDTVVHRAMQVRRAAYKPSMFVHPVLGC